MFVWSLSMLALAHPPVWLPANPGAEAVGDPQALVPVAIDHAALPLWLSFDDQGLHVVSGVGPQVPPDVDVALSFDRPPDGAPWSGPPFVASVRLEVGADGRLRGDISRPSWPMTRQAVLTEGTVEVRWRRQTWSGRPDAGAIEYPVRFRRPIDVDAMIPVLAAFEDSGMYWSPASPVRELWRGGLDGPAVDLRDARPLVPDGGLWSMPRRDAVDDAERFWVASRSSALSRDTDLEVSGPVAVGMAFASNEARWWHRGVVWTDHDTLLPVDYPSSLVRAEREHQAHGEAFLDTGELGTLPTQLLTRHLVQQVVQHGATPPRTGASITCQPPIVACLEAGVGAPGIAMAAMQDLVFAHRVSDTEVHVSWWRMNRRLTWRDTPDTSTELHQLTEQVLRDPVWVGAIQPQPSPWVPEWPLEDLVRASLLQEAAEPHASLLRPAPGHEVTLLEPMAAPLLAWCDERLVPVAPHEPRLGVSLYAMDYLLFPQYTYALPCASPLVLGTGIPGLAPGPATSVPVGSRQAFVEPAAPPAAPHRFEGPPDRAYDVGAEDCTYPEGGYRGCDLEFAGDLNDDGVLDYVVAWYGESGCGERNLYLSGADGWWVVTRYPWHC